MSQLPYEMIHHILDYLGDIDVRRNMGFYRPIDLKKFSILHTITRTANMKQRREFPNYLYQQYLLINLYQIDERIDSDHIEMKVALHEGKVKYNYGIYRLMPKSDNPVLGENPSRAVAPPNYKWHSITYSFDLS